MARIGRACDVDPFLNSRTHWRIPMSLRWSVILGGCLAVGIAAAQSKPPQPAPATPPAQPAAAAPAAAQAAPAATPAASPPGVKASSPCKQDVESFCGDVQPGGGRVYRCLAEHEGELSNSCRARLADIRATGGECKEDIAKFCADVPHTKGKLADCLTQHHDELSEACKTLSTQAKAAVKAPATPPAAPAAAVPAAPAAAAPAATPPATTPAPAPPPKK